MNTTKPLPPELREAIQSEAEVRSFDAVATRWLALLLQNDPTLPAPTAGAMVARVGELPVGENLAALDAGLQHLGARDPGDLTTSERRVTAMLLEDLISTAQALLTVIA